MKKYTAIALLAITLISCKKETKTVSKTDPVTGKTTSVEVPVEETQKVEETFAIKDSAGVYKQGFKLEKGQTYPLTTYTRNIQTVTDPSGKTMSGTSESTDEMSFTVNDFKDGIYDISINLISKRNSESMNGKTMAVDTKAAAPKEDQLKMMWNVNKALTGNKLQMKMKENGEVISISGFEPVYNKITASAGTMIKDGKQKAAFAQSFKESFNEKVLKDQFSKNLMVLPKKGAKIGEKWTESENASQDGKVKMTTTFTLKSVENGKATVAVTGGIPYKSDKKAQQGMTHTMSSEMSQNGNIVLDQATGWITNQNVNLKTSQTESISDGKKTQSMKSVSNTTVMVNPSAK